MIDLTNLQAIASVSIEDFKNAYQNGNSVAAAYYAELAAQGTMAGNANINNYATLATEVATNTGIRGEIANKFSENVAVLNFIDFSVGSDAWLQMQYTLMQNDFIARNLDSDGELDFRQTNDIHTLALSAVNLPPAAYSLYAPLERIAKNDPVMAQTVFEQAYTGAGYIDDLLTDAYQLSTGGVDFDAAYNGDLLAQIGWMVHAYSALTAVGANYTLSAAELNFIDKYEQLQSYAGSSLQNIGNWLEFFADNLTESLSLPTWLINFINSYSASPYTIRDPLMVDLDGDGISADLMSTSLFGVYFDRDNDGFAESTNWVNGDDAFLVRDLNGNGRIDDTNEMFGARLGGFEMLGMHDENHDGLINASDAVWNDLLLWRDVNADGQTQGDELLTLAAFGITGFDVVNYAYTGQISGVTHVGTALTDSGAIELSNVNLTYNELNTRYNGDYDFDIRAAFLPSIRGYAQVPDMHIALSLDNDEQDPDSLMALMLSLKQRALTDIFTEWTGVKSTVAQLLFRWVGVDEIAPDSRGPYISDARILEFLETYTGTPFIDPNEGNTDPGLLQGKEIQRFWDDIIFPRLMGHVLHQMAGGELFESGINFNYEQDRFEPGTAIAFSQDAFDALTNTAAGLTDTQARLTFWVNVIEYIDAVMLSKQGSYSDYLSTIVAAIEASDTNLVWAEALHDPDNGIYSVEYRRLYPVGDEIQGTEGVDDYSQTPLYAGTTGDDIMAGNGGADILHGGDAQDILYGHSQTGTGDDGAADTLYGGDGDDELYGNDGNDELYGGAGSDYMEGGAGDDLLVDGRAADGQDFANGGEGNDTYMYSGGSQRARYYIQDDGGTDSLTISNLNFSLGSTTFTRWVDDDLQIDGFHPNGGFTFYLIDQLREDVLYDDTGLGIERIWLDSQWYDLKDLIINYTGTIKTQGTGQDDIIYGITYGSPDELITAWDGNDTVYAADGNDEVYGEAGNDTLYGGIGDDELDGGDGDDILYGESGDDQLIGGAGNNALYGGEGNDFLHGLNGDDILEGGAGDDTLDGNGGNNIYRIGSGIDKIEWGNGQNIIELPEGITLEDIELVRDARAVPGRADIGDLIINANGAAIGFIEGYFNTQNARVIEIHLADGTVIDDLTTRQYTTHGTDASETINGILSGQGDKSDIIYGHGGNDTINAGDNDDYIDGGAGNDLLKGQGGNDTYTFGSGHDTIDDTLGNNILDLGTNYGFSDLTMSRSGLYDVVVAATDGSMVTLKNQMHNTVTGIKWLKFGEYLVDIYSLPFEYYGTSGDDSLQGGDNNAKDVIWGLEGNDTISTAAGNDFLAGGDGDDELYGGTDDDIYYYEAGIDFFQENGGYDTIWFSEDVTIYDITVTDFNVYDTKISLNSGIDEIQIYYQRYISSPFLAFEELQFSNGLEVLLNGYNNWLWGSDNSEIINGTSQSNTILAAGGSDTLSGLAGDDVIDGGAGNDIITGGVGDDKLHGDTGNDVYVYNLGDGHDHITDTKGVMDQIIFGDGIALEDVNLSYIGLDDLLISFAGDYQNSIYIHGHDNLDGTRQIEKLIFSDGREIILHISLNAITGSASSNTLNGSEVADHIDTMGGHDTVNAGAGDDVIIGGTGNDTLYGEDGDDTFLINGTGDGIDRIIGGAGFDTIEGSAADDTIRLSSITAADGIEVIDGKAGYNVIAGSHTNSVMDFSATTLLNIALIDGDNGNDTITGSAGNDTIMGGAGSDTMNGGEGDDTFLVHGTGNGIDLIIGGAGHDEIIGSAEDDHIYLSRLNTGDSIEVIDGGEGVNVLIGSHTNTVFDFTNTTLLNIDRIEAGNGNDTITGSAGNDTIIGGAGADTLRGEDGDDTFIVTGVGAGMDRIIGGVGYDRILGGVGYDTIQLSRLDTADSIELIDGGDDMNGIVGSHTNTVFDFSATTLVNIDYIDGGNGNDTITGSAGNDSIIGGAGADTLRGEDGDDVFMINGTDNGIDRIYGGAGLDTIQGSDQDDNIWLSGYNAADGIEVIDGGSGVNVITGSHTNTVYDFTDVELINIAQINGANGNDSITGSAGNDTILGGTGTDTLDGGAGDDTLYGGDGLDALWGGTGADTFVFESANAFNNADRIYDFSTLDGDILDIADLVEGYDPLTHAIADFVQITDNGTHSYLAVDVDGGGDNFVQVAELRSVTGLTDEDLLLTNGNLAV